MTNHWVDIKNADVVLIMGGNAAGKHRYDPSSWGYELDEKGYAKVDPTLEHPRCVLQIMKRHYARYTPDMVARVCGTPKEKFLKICDMIASTAEPRRAMTIM